ncbi:MAG: proline--tRNA ligase [archaeon]|nr:proline--tRNA ligase [archaeon]
MGKTENVQMLGITVKKDEDFSEWYNQVVQKAQLADYGPVKGFMVIRPHGYALWEAIQNYFNKVMDKHKVSNAYFPLLIPESFFRKEAEHAQGFEPELAWIEKSKGEESKDEERVAIRPTSETIMYDSYAKWIRSWRDLPLRINQWCNVLRWEVKQTKLFLRTREFLWQEGHCVYATKEECDKEVRLFLDAYKKMVEELLAIPVIAGKKTDSEKFAGALYTTTIEALMPDGKSLQMGTSHNLGQGFAKSFGLKFLDEESKEQLPWQSSWGFSTRLIGSIVMVHGDDKGVVLPPRIAKQKAVIVPILFDNAKEKVLKKCSEVEKTLSSINAFVDDRENYSPGWKYSDAELKGIPLRLEIGPKDLEKKHVVVVRRDNGKKEFVKEKDIKKRVGEILEEMHSDMFNKAKKFMDANIVEAKNWSEFEKGIKSKKMVSVHFCGDASCEEEIKSETTATSRCIPFDQKKSEGKCVKCEKPSKEKVLFAKSY